MHLDGVADAYAHERPRHASVEGPELVGGLLVEPGLDLDGLEIDPHRLRGAPGDRRRKVGGVPSNVGHALEGVDVVEPVAAGLGHRNVHLHGHRRGGKRVRCAQCDGAERQAGGAKQHAAARNIVGVILGSIGRGVEMGIAHVSLQIKCEA